MAMMTKEEWFDAMIAAGHTPIMYDKSEFSARNMDQFVVDQSFHNGPGCSKCRWSCCYHCLDITKIPKCE